MWYPTLPFISSFSFPIQSLILLLLIPTCYFKPTLRIGVLGLIAANYTIKILIPLSVWLFWLFKMVAWAGFYVYFFQRAMEYGWQAVGMMDNVQTGLGMMFLELDKLDRRRKEEDEPRQEEQEVEVKQEVEVEVGGGNGWPDEPSPHTESVHMHADGGDFQQNQRAYVSAGYMGGGYETPELSEIGLGNVSDDEFQANEHWRSG